MSDEPAGFQFLCPQAARKPGTTEGACSLDVCVCAARASQAAIHRDAYMPFWPNQDKPGVPRNAHLDGEHWLIDINGDHVIGWWNAGDVQRWGHWPFTRPEEMAVDNSYVGPALTPPQVEARIKLAWQYGQTDALNMGPGIPFTEDMRKPPGDIMQQVEKAALEQEAAANGE